jgi:HTH-type transcriptional regulator/antitoxin HipB
MDFKRKRRKLQRMRLNLQKNLKNNISMAKTTNKLTSFSAHLDKEYGVKGTSTRDEYEQEFEIFKLGVMLQELRKEKGLTQEQLADKCGTTKTYISRIENNSSDIRLSTLKRIIQVGLGGKLNINVRF